MLDELKKLFIQEVKELLEKTESNLLLLEKDHSNKDLLMEIYRTMHTIKGSAGVYNLKKTILIAHSFEDLFKKIEDSRIEINNKIISLSLKAVDTIIKLIESDDESNVPNDDIDYITSSIIEINNSAETQTSSEEDDDKPYSSYYILFEPNSDISERFIKTESIISDFDDFNYKIINEYYDEERLLNNKLCKFYEIIVATNYQQEELDAIFLFVPDEYISIKFCDFNIFKSQDFHDFYNNAVKIIPDVKLHYDLIQNFANTVDPELLIEEEKTVVEDEFDFEIKEVIKEEVNTNIFDIDNKALQYIKVPAEKLDLLLNQVSELIINNSQLYDRAKNQDIEKINFLSENIAKITNAIKENTLTLRLVPIENLIFPLRRVVRDLSIKLNKKINFVEQGIDTQVDKTIIDALHTPLLHVIRNAIDHGIEIPEERRKLGKKETGIIRFIAYYSNTNVIVQIQDDGKGIDPEFIRKKAVEKGIISPNDKLNEKEIYDLVFVHGFTTAENITDVSGRGVGMDAIKKVIQDLRGDIEIDSEIGLGTSVTIKLPLTLSIIEALHVATNNVNFLIPISNIEHCIKIKTKDIVNYSGSRIIINDELLPYVDIKELFKIKGPKKEEVNIVIIKNGRERVGLIFNDIYGEYQAVIKNMGSVFDDLDFFIGASILGDSSIAYIIDTYKLIKRIKSTNKITS